MSAGSSLRIGSDLRAVRGAGLIILALGAAGVLVSARSRLPHEAEHAAAAERPAGASVTAPPITGMATFYGARFDGLLMADGARFDMNDPTIAAANIWPLGTTLRVRRIPGGPWDGTLTPAERATFFGRTITVTVRDRGAFNHALDLSRGAFALLGRTDEGLIHVGIEVVGSEAEQHDQR